MSKLFVCAILGLVVTGCSTIVTHRADLNSAPKGVRVYPPKVYLLVDAKENETTLAYLPDYSQAYDIKPVTVLAKQDFKIELDDGQVKSFAANQDTVAILTFVKDSAALAVKAAGVAAAAPVIKGTFGLESGIYRLDNDGVFRKMTENKPPAPAVIL